MVLAAAKNTFTFRLTANSTKYTTLKGKQYLVVPTVILTEGVHNGSNGPLFYSAEELAKAPAVWNHKPVVIYHPKDGKSATDHDVLETTQVGMMMNTRWDSAAKKLRTDVYLDEAEVNKIQPEVLEAIRNKQPVEVSTGLFSEDDDETGTWNTEDYVGSVHNIRPDHLAILYGQTGACSIADGAGLLVTNAEKVAPLRDAVVKTVQNRLKLSGVELTNNELHFSAITSKLYSELGAKYGEKGKSWYGWIEAVYNGRVIFENTDRKLYSQEYSVNANDQVSLVGEAEEVTYKTEYVVKKNGSKLTANEAGEVILTLNEEKDVAKTAKEHVDELITNGGYTEDQRAWLTGLGDAVTNIKPIPKAVEPPKETPVVNKEEKPVEKKATLEELLQNADPDTVEGFAILKSQAKQLKDGYVQIITNAPGNKYNKEWLEKQTPAVLEGIVSIVNAAKAAKNDPNDPPVLMNGGGNWLGAAGAPPAVTAPLDNKPMTRPTQNFASPVGKNG